MLAECVFGQSFRDRVFKALEAELAFLKRVELASCRPQKEAPTARGGVDCGRMLKEGLNSDYGLTRKNPDSQSSQTHRRSMF